jgi:hypothetical protein
LALSSVLLASALLPSGAAGAVFTATPPETVSEGSGLLTWTFAGDAPGTIWGDVTWKVSTEAEWHMCGGPAGVVTLEGLAAGTYWVEIADEVDPALAGDSAGSSPFDRCTESHSPALGPLRPVTLAAVTVLPRPAGPATATTTVNVVGPRCRKPRPRPSPGHAHRQRSRPAHGCGTRASPAARRRGT